MKGEKASEAIREVRIANTSAWVSGTPMSTAPQRLSPLSTCSSITCECKAERRVSGSGRCLAVIEIEHKKKIFIYLFYSMDSCPIL